MSDSQREHLFINYATEDAVLAEWLSLKLIAEGYKVWCDRVKLLGGESYPRDIDSAIKERTFRVLALLSHHSINKENPLKERTLAHAISKERGINFVIPINVDGLSSTELGWMNSDLVFIPFYQNWGKGLRQLLNKLQSIETPQALSEGKSIAAQCLSFDDRVAPKIERLWTNLLEIKKIPTSIYKHIFAEKPWANFPNSWIYYRQSDTVFWSFEPLVTDEQNSVRSEVVDWQKDFGLTNIPLEHVVIILLKKHINRLCIRKGLVLSENNDLYFPDKNKHNNWLRFESYDGKKKHILAVGERKFKSINYPRIQYHLSPIFHPVLFYFEKPVVQVQLRVYLTDLAGRMLPKPMSLGRRKRILKNWWNYEWLSRLLAVCNCLSDEKKEFDIATNFSYSIVISAVPIQLKSPVGITGIDESKLVESRLMDNQELPDDESSEVSGIDDD